MGWTLKWRKAKGSPVSEPSADLAIGCVRAESAKALMATPRRMKLIEHIWQRTSLSRQQFDRLYLEPLHRFAELVQHLPASRNHHHAYHGGMLDHGLEIVAYALKMRQSYLLPLGTTPETQAAQTEAWTAAIAYAALLHDIGKIAVDVEVDLASGKRWHPWQGPIKGDYRFRFVEGREYKLHAAAAGLIYNQVLSSNVMDWLSGFPELWSALIYVLADQYEHAGILGELVIQADRASVAQELGGNPIRAMDAPKQSLQRQLVDGLRHLVHDQLKLNQPEASDGWLTQDGLWLVSKTVADKLRAYLLAQGIEGIPSSNSTFFNILQDHGIIQPNAEGKAIWKADVDSGRWQMTLTFLKLSPALIWAGDDRPPAFAGTVIEHTQASDRSNEKPVVSDQPVIGIGDPQKNPTLPPCPIPPSRVQVDEKDGVEDLLQLLGMNEPSEQPVGTLPPHKNIVLHQPTVISEYEVRNVFPDNKPLHILNNKNKLGDEFIRWVRLGVVEHRIIINDAKAKIHSVADTAFIVTPEIFQRYAQEHPELIQLAKSESLSDWRLVQRAFEKLGIHKKRDDGLNIWTCEVKGPRKTRSVKGYLLQDYSVIFTEKPYNNPYLTIINS
ncbi:MobH family relaxase [Pseudomonas sp. DWP3-1-2]|uniref:MobH family relaxase n=1 Tax=Pseudomonas sp. DWP3-1-2 TaxID=2804645 RepID=UPI003CFB5ADF